jgi:hypothetical protein
MAHCYRTAGCALLMAVVLAAGCGEAPPPIVNVEGTVRLGGKPLNKVRVVFISLSKAGKGYIASGVTDEEGRYRLTRDGQPGACAGENRVLVQESDAPRELLGESLEAQAGLVKYYQSLGNRPIPALYGTAVQSPLRATVTADQEKYDFDLKP